MNQLLKLARMEEGTIQSVSNLNGVYFCRVNIDNFHAVDFPIDGLPQFTVVSNSPVTLRTESVIKPKSGSRVLVLLKDPENIDSGGYILGYLNNSTDQLIKKDSVTQLSEGSHLVKTESGSGMVMENEKKESSMFAGDSYIRLNNQKVELKKNGAGLEILKDSINLANSDNSATLYLDKKDSMLYNKGNISTVTPNGAQINRGLSKQEKFSGKIQRESTSIEERSQSRVLTAGYLKYIGLNGKAFGGDHTIEISSLIGDIVVTNTSGDIFVQNLNPLNDIVLFNGPLPSTKLSSIKISKDLIQLKNIFPSSKIELLTTLGDIETTANLGKITITADVGDIKIEATLGKIDVHSLQGIDIKAGPDLTQKNLLGEDSVDKWEEMIGVITDYMTDIISGDFAIGVLIGGFLPSPSVISKTISARIKLNKIKGELKKLLSKKVTIN